MKKVRPHGTYTKYVVERCHCEECREANRTYERRRTRERLERQYGMRPPLFVDAGDAREHLFCLSAAGIGPLQVQRIAGVGKTAQWKIRSRRVKRIRPETEAAIMGVRTDAHVFLRSKVDSAEAKTLVAELLDAGLTKAAIGQALGGKSPSLQAAKTEHCTLRTLKALRLLREAVRREQARSA